MSGWLPGLRLTSAGTPGPQQNIGKPDEAQKALDQLFVYTMRYRSREGYRRLLEFVARFRVYSPYNAMLIYTQLPGAGYTAPPGRWLREYRRRIKADARPIVILQPGGPVLFVFDVADTETLPDAPPLPREVTHPFEVHRGAVESELEVTIGNAVRDGIRVSTKQFGPQSAGSIRYAITSASQDFLKRKFPRQELVGVPVRYELSLNNNLSRAAQYATLVHELAHLYCGHLGTSNPAWWPDRQGLPLNCKEFEAESVCWLVCERLGIENPSDAYLHAHLESCGKVPPISLELVMAASGLIQAMGKGRLPLRTPGPGRSGG